VIATQIGKGYVVTSKNGYVFLEADMAPLINELKDSLDGQ
jgi:hypothetical protein